MATWLKQSTAVDIGFGPFLDDTDGKTAETGLTITQPDIRLKKNGGNWAQKSAAQTLSHEEAGWYEIALSSTDTDTLGILIVAVHESGALPVWREFMVMPAMIYDSLVGGSDRLDVNVTHAVDVAWASGAITAAVIATDAIDADAIAASAIDAGSIATGAITNAKFAAGAIDAAAIAADAIGASELATDAVTEIVTAVWAATTRVLTANTNLNDLNAAGIRSAIGMGSANLDTQLAAIDDPVDTEVAAIKTVVDAIKLSTDNLPSDPADASVVAGLLSTMQGNVTSILAAVDTEVGAIKTVTDKLDTGLVLDGAVYQWTANALELAPSGGGGGGGLDAAGVRAAIGLGSANLDTQLSGLDTLLDAILADTDAIDTRLPSDPADASVVAGLIAGLEAKVDTIDGIVDAILVDTGTTLDAAIADLPTNAELATALGTADDAVLAQVALVKAKTDLIPSDPADASDIATLIDALPTAAENATAVWGAGTRSLTILDEDSTTLDLDATIRAAVGMSSANLDTTLSGISSKTTNLPSDPADQSLIIAATDAIMTAIGDVPTNSELATALAAADDAVLAAISALNNLSASQVNAEVVDALNVDTYAQPGQVAIPATASLARKINDLHKMMRNRKDQTATTFSLYNDDASTVDHKATVSDDGTTFSRGEMAVGP